MGPSFAVTPGVCLTAGAGRVRDGRDPGWATLVSAGARVRTCASGSLRVRVERVGVFAGIQWTKRKGCVVVTGTSGMGTSGTSGTSGPSGGRGRAGRSRSVGVTWRSRGAGTSPIGPLPAAAGAGADVAVEEDADVVAANEDAFRAMPLAVGGGSVLALLLNRVLSGVAPVADASSSQSRADVLCLAMAGCLVLTGLTWIALKPKTPVKVVLNGVDRGAGFVDPALAPDAAAELRWCWDALRASTATGAVAVFYDGRRVMQAGVVPKNAVAGAADGRLTAEAPRLGDICRRCMETGGGNYLANLALFPGRVEFAPYLPDNTQAVVIAPIGNEGVIVAASGTQRGFTPADQAWIAVMAEKLDQTLSGEERA